MTMIPPIIADFPVDLLIAGELMRDAALSWPVTDAAGLVASSTPMSPNAALNATVRPLGTVAGLSAYPPMASDMATTDGGSNVTTPMTARVNGAICTQDGVNVPFAVFDDCRIPMIPTHSGRWQLAMQTQDANGAALGGCRVVVLDLGQIAVGLPAVVAEGVSDGSGNATLIVPQNQDYMVVAYLSGSPDRAGVTVQTLTPDPA